MRTIENISTQDLIAILKHAKEIYSERSAHERSYFGGSDSWVYKRIQAKYNLWMARVGILEDELERRYKDDIDRLITREIVYPEDIKPEEYG